ncbi:13625_t:CDS:2 [Ambispora leptoticha]|uniref:13625_t:CDS:1 n=1 Tax=Ambispora leptoticha TaxID=144679 RepID=A0A9N9BX83_9GLOM|nr:13625_t:CDS:2 [Ambispora leptoticha]
MADTESTPLLNQREEPSSFESLRKRLLTRETLILLLLGLILVFLVLNVILFIVQTDEPKLPSGISDVPNHYQLRVSSRFAINFRWDYVLEAAPPLDLTSLPNRENKKQVKDYLLELNEKYSSSDKIASNNNNLTNFEDPDTPEFAELVSRSNKLWSPAYYEAREYREDENGLVSLVASTIASEESNFFSLTPSVIISFTRAKKLEATNIQSCQYKITWTSPVSDGLIKRKCPRAGEWRYRTISIVKGTSEWGMEFFDANEDLHYAVATRPSYHWNSLQKRIVLSYPDAPFPPILPAIYTAYYDYHTNRKNAKDLRLQEKENQ